jgi:hypothetical protein
VEFKTTTNITIKTKIRCPKCKQTFDKPAEDGIPLRCQHCGTQLNISRESMDDAMREAESRIAGRTLGSMNISLPQQYAGLAKARSLSRPLNTIGVLATIWAIIVPLPYTIAVGVCALVPIASLLAMMSLKGSISFETKNKSEVPSLTFALAAPSAALAWRALNDFHILLFDNAWMPAIAVSILFSVLILLFSADVKRKPAYLLVTLIFGFMYGYGAVIEANCLLDWSLPQTYRARVLDKRTSYSSKSHSYYIKVTPWGPRNDEQEISIKKGEFSQIRVNDEITMNLKSGTLDIPWFVIQLKK